MRKQILSLICLTGFALIYSVARVVADPAEDADRRFLNNLENGNAPQATSAKAPATNSAPATKTARSNSAASQKSVAEKSSDSEKTAKRTHKQQPAVAAQATHAPTVGFGGQLDKPTDADNPPSRVHKRAMQDQSAEVAETAPVPPGTVTERRVTIVRTPNVDDDHDRDQDDHEHHHHFFHRLFSHLFNNQHPEDW
jgi:hypothetical protein